MPRWLLSLGEYMRRVLVSWWTLVIGVGAAGLGALNLAFGVEAPTTVWLGLGVGGLLVAQFIAFHRVRVQRDRSIPSGEPPDVDVQAWLIVGSVCFQVTNNGPTDSFQATVEPTGNPIEREYLDWSDDLYSNNPERERKLPSGGHGI